MIKVARGCLKDEELAEVREAFEYGYFGLAAKVDEFERALEAFLGSPHVIAVNTGTSALHLALDALGIGHGDEVLVPSLTFVASYQAITMTGATPVSCEVSPDTLLLDLEDMERRLTERTRAVMPVHYAGNPCDMDRILSWAEKNSLRVVEDAAHAFGSFYKGKRIGSFGDIACFSFDSIKNITCGEGGAIAFRDDSLVDLLKKKRLLGIHRPQHSTTSWKERPWRYDVSVPGFRYHMSNINAAIGLAQLKKVEQFLERRRMICARYQKELSSLSGLTLLDIPYDSIAPHIFVVRVPGGRRDRLMQFLRDRDIETGISYIPNHMHSFYHQEGLSLPVTERVFQEILTLPLHFELSDEEVDKVIGSIREFFSQEARTSP